MSADRRDADETTEQFDRSEIPDTWGVEKLACANYQSFETVVDKVAARRGVDRVDLREGLAHWLDHDRTAAREEYDIPNDVLDEAANACTDVVIHEYEFLTQ